MKVSVLIESSESVDVLVDGEWKTIGKGSELSLRQTPAHVPTPTHPYEGVELRGGAYEVEIYIDGTYQGRLVFDGQFTPASQDSVPRYEDGPCGREAGIDCRYNDYLPSILVMRDVIRDGQARMDAISDEVDSRVSALFTN